MALSLNKSICRLKLPFKIKILVWFLLKGVIVTKESLIKKNWNVIHKCCFATTRKPPNTYFSVVMLQDLFDESFKLHLVYGHQVTSQTTFSRVYASPS